MKKYALSLFAIGLLGAALTACGGASGGGAEPAGSAAAVQEPAPEANPESTEQPSSETRTITYLGQSFELPARTDRIVITGAVEAMEDAILLDLRPVGAITFSGVFPPLFAGIAEEAVSIGEKTEPNFETILSLKPDVILGTTKFKPEVAEQLQKIAPMIAYSHIATNWEANLTLLGELSGKQAEAKQAIEAYRADLAEAKSRLGDKLQNQKVAIVRIRSGELYVYPQDVFFNPSLYADLGFAVPEEIQAAKAQELMSVERFAEMNPDLLFIQFSEDENREHPDALEQLRNNPILKNVNALKNDKTFVNVVDPLTQGGTAFSKIEFLKAAVPLLSE